MKRLLWFLALPLFTQAQSFQKHDIILGAGIDLGIYGTQGTNLVTLVENKDAAGSTIIPLGMEYGVTNHIGIGFQVRLNDYFGGHDTSSARNNDYTLMANLHFLRTRLFNMQIGVKYGISDFHYENNITHSVFDATGGQFQLDLGANVYLGSHVGFQFHAAYNNLSYLKGAIKDTYGNKTDYKLLLNGADIGVGLLFRI